MPQSQPPKEIGNSNVLASVLMPHLQNLFQQTSIQQDIIINLLSNLQTVEVENALQNGKLPPLPRVSDTNGNVESIAAEREMMLHMKISELQARMNSLTDELNAKKLKYTQSSGKSSVLESIVGKDFLPRERKGLELLNSEILRMDLLKFWRVTWKQTLTNLENCD